MDDLLISLPAFNRLSDYLGLWAMNPLHFDALWRHAHALDMRAHMLEAVAVKSSLQKSPNGRGVAIIQATGVLMKSASSLGGTSTIQLRRDIRQAAADPDISGILLAIDSPGGTVSGTADLGAEVRNARKSKPVFAHVDDLTASAAYWLASQAEKVYANDSTAMIGSIGTYQIVRDLSGMAEKEGVKTHVIATGPLKGMGAPGAPVTDEQLAHVQAMVDATQTHFDAAVRKGRSLSAAELKAVRHGGLLMADDALAARLIDGVQPMSKTLAELNRVAAAYDPRRAEAGDDVPEPESERIPAGRSGGFPMKQLSGLPMLRAGV